jgi:hypothetical protein
MQQAVKTGVADARLTLAEVLDWLVEDRLVAREAADALKIERRYHRGNVHPLRSGSPSISAWTTCTSIRSRSTSPR